MDATLAQGIAMCAILAKWKDDASLSITPNGLHHSDTAIYLAVAIDFDIKICMGINITDETQLEFTTLGEVITTFFNTDLDLIPRITKEQFYSFKS